MAKATYEDYSNALKEKDSWNDIIKELYNMNIELSEYATGSVDESVRDLLEKAYSLIINDKVWQGKDAIACANTIWDIRNEVQRHSNFLYEARKKLEAAALDRQHEAQAKVDQVLADLDGLGKVELTARSIVGADLKRK